MNSSVNQIENFACGTRRKNPANFSIITLGVLR